MPAEIVGIPSHRLDMIVAHNQPYVTSHSLSRQQWRNPERDKEQRKAVFKKT
jgi:hypothetical protein